MQLGGKKKEPSAGKIRSGTAHMEVAVYTIIRGKWHG
jgi:hypothetical protein